jgi:UbiD family decarboxylase
MLAMTHYNDLRGYLEALDELGDLTRIGRDVSWHLEAGAITRLSYERNCPAALFENIHGVAPGFRLLGAPGGISSIRGKPLARIALSVGLPADTTPAHIVDHLARSRDLAPIPPRKVAPLEAACKQNILRGEHASLDRFPIPQIHLQDGGRYANTWGVIVARTPDSAWTNWTITRIMMIDGKHMTGLVIPSQHLGLIWTQWAKLGKPMPYALVQGAAPAVPVVGGLPLPQGVDEGGYVGTLHGEPLDVVACETSDLDVPAAAEIVIEGNVSVGRDGVEGPMGEFPGYVHDQTSMQPVFSVDCITHRDNPIWPLVAAGRPVDETHTVAGVGVASEILADLRSARLPVTTVWLPLLAAMHWTVITVPANWREQLPDTDSHEFVHRIGKVLQLSRSGRHAPQAYVLDDDIDPADDTDLIWALATRVHPDHRAEPWLGPINPLMTSYTPTEHASHMGPVVVHDALLPAGGHGRLPHSSFAQAYPRDIQDRVLAHWNG